MQRQKVVRDSAATASTPALEAVADGLGGVTTRASSTSSYDARAADHADRRIRFYGAPGCIPGRSDAALRLLPGPAVLHVCAHRPRSEAGRLLGQTDEP